MNIFNYKIYIFCKIYNIRIHIYRYRDNTIQGNTPHQKPPTVIISPNFDL